jgi:predicted nucleic acid-binding protein
MQVLDVNLWISGLLWQGVPKQIIGLARSKAVTGE